MDSAGFADALTDTGQLRDHYREPSRLVRGKITDTLDEHCRDFIARSTFVLVASASKDGHIDVSPKGGPRGFVKVLDDQRLAIPDLNGNNLLDSLHNLIETGQAGLLFVVPGLGETLRVNGAAAITTDPSVLDLVTDDVRRPTTAIGVTVREAYIHCAKAFRRGGIWQPEAWPEAGERPSPVKALGAHVGLDEATVAEIEANLEQSYEQDLAADRPVR
jgi:PPOX class probable FMN-dependent enzyme